MKANSNSKKYSSQLSGMLVYQKKFLCLIAGTIVLVVIAYQFAIKKSIQLSQQNRALKKQVHMIQNAPEKLKALRERNAYYDAFIVETEDRTSNKRNDLMAASSDYCVKNNISIREVPTPVVEKVNDYIIETNRFTLKGKFKNLLQYVHYLEREENHGAIRSVRFYAHKPPREQEKELLLDVYIQNLVKFQNYEN